MIKILRTQITMHGKISATKTRSRSHMHAVLEKPSYLPFYQELYFDAWGLRTLKTAMEQLYPTHDSQHNRHCPILQSHAPRM